MKKSSIAREVKKNPKKFQQLQRKTIDRHCFLIVSTDDLTQLKLLDQSKGQQRPTSTWLQHDADHDGNDEYLTKLWEKSGGLLFGKRCM